MATFTFTLQGSSDTVIGATDRLQFAGASGFDSKVTVGAYNDSTHVKSSADANDSNGNTPENNKYVSGTTADWGDGVENLNLITEAECALKINFSDAASVEITDAIFYAYDGSTTTAVPTGVTFQAAEQGDAAWTNAEGSAAAVTLADQAAATSHDYFIAVSASPESVGLKSAFAIRVELTYS
jgi:hypothetical protein